MNIRPLPLAAALSACALFSGVCAEDAAPVDSALILRTLKTLRDTETAQIKTGKAKALQTIQGAVSDPSHGLEMWEEAVRATQFAGAAREGTAFHDWKEKEGEALKEKECATALYLYYSWLSLTLQRASGAKVKDLLPALVNYTKEATADATAMEAFVEASKREKEMEGNRKHGQARKGTANDDEVKRMHDQIVKQSVTSSVVVQWLRMEPYLDDVTKPTQGQAQGSGWEMTPGNVDGIFQRIILPELRAQKDPRVIEYWDMKIRLEADEATRAKKDFDADKFNQIRKPQLLWSRAQDLILIGQKNRGIGEMFKIVQANPTHPEAAAWITALEQALAPTPAGGAADVGAPPQ